MVHHAFDFIHTQCRIYCGIRTYLHNFRIICIKQTWNYSDNRQQRQSGFLQALPFCLHLIKSSQSSGVCVCCHKAMNASEYASSPVPFPKSGSFFIHSVNLFINLRQIANNSIEQQNKFSIRTLWKNGPLIKNIRIKVSASDHFTVLSQSQKNNHTPKRSFGVGG